MSNPERKQKLLTADELETFDKFFDLIAPLWDQDIQDDWPMPDILPRRLDYREWTFMIARYPRQTDKP